jgi:cell wall-associated NlpC family hydrolase
MSDIGNAIASAAASYAGTPFVHLGRVPGVGLDCAGVVFCAAWQAGLELEDARNYGKIPQANYLLEMLSARCRNLDGESPRPGDVVLFQFSSLPMHFGILLNDNRMAHALEGRRRVLVGPMGSAWESKLHSCWRLMGAD